MKETLLLFLPTFKPTRITMATCPKHLFGKYHLKSFNGKSALEGELAGVTLELGEEDGRVTVRAKAGNAMSGVLKYEGGMLTGPLMSTMMMPPPAVLKVERTLVSGFSSGMHALREGSSLTLSHKTDTMVFEAVE
ncbi:hypothetical protein, conserved [Trypanosoma brucei brucei TREU927]|uniref:DUF306 domain-containing protein n=2 Tax=Eukaryota TaxID=2759 RepID=Q582E9_TRYB2|nr:hypothetical protein, conserved [Trypanosoma brucei brucei TREU927]AAX80421.1 hypothetical protein, conserved [Trypanosoma brucei]AAZ11331.1 hypothetical protein, conserved [Trypanosoma brucei brucei TREU927]